MYLEVKVHILQKKKKLKHVAFYILKYLALHFSNPIVIIITIIMMMMFMFYNCFQLFIMENRHILVVHFICSLFVSLYYKYFLSWRTEKKKTGFHVENVNKKTQSLNIVQYVAIVWQFIYRLPGGWGWGVARVSICNIEGTLLFRSFDTTLLVVSWLAGWYVLCIEVSLML